MIPIYKHQLIYLPGFIFGCFHVSLHHFTPVVLKHRYQMQFDTAIHLVNSCPDEVDISTEEKLLLYSYFKQATIGDCTSDRPPFYQLVDRTKYDAHYRLKGMSADDAKSNYIKEVRRILERVKHEYPLIAQQLNVAELHNDQDSLEANEAKQPSDQSISLELVKENRTLTAQLKWMKRLSFLLFLIILLQFKVPRLLKALVQTWFNKN